jgi:hypothetical protein
MELLLSFQIIFFLYPYAQAVKFGLLNWMNAEAFFYWPAAV